MFDFSQDDIKYALIGGISGWLVTYITLKFHELAAFITQYNKITPYLRTWHAYHWSRLSHKPLLRAATWVFKRDFPIGIKVDVTDDKGIVKSYKGKVSFEINQMIILGESYYPDETWSARLINPQDAGPDTIMFGIQLVQDFDRNILATITVCSQEKKTDEEAARLISEYTSSMDKESILRCNQ